MTEYFTPAWSGESTAHARGVTDAVPAPRREELPCESYLPGHHIHATDGHRSLPAAPRLVRRVRVDGFRVHLVLDDGDQLAWRHHDPVRLSRALETVPGTVAAYLDLHLLRVGSYSFNCATPQTGWEPCRRLPDS